MAVYTRFGSEVKVIRYDEHTGIVSCIRLEDNATREWHISELKADNGASEIINQSK